jgi:hypothetical protein
MQSKKIFDPIILILLTTLVITSYIIGFAVNENSTGGAINDSEHIWSNLQIFLNNDLKSAIVHDNYFDGRLPIAYIFHKYFNPFVTDIYHYRVSVFAISFLLPLVFFIALKRKFLDQKNSIFLLATLIIFINPYFRSSSYWGLQENYGLFFLITSFLAFVNYYKNKSIKNIFFICVLSSLTFYFDQKLLIVPLLCFLSIIFQAGRNKEKLYAVFFYSIFSLPLLYLIYVWGSILHPGAHSRIQYFSHENLGYALSIIAFYVLPFIILKKNITPIKDFFLNKINILLLLIIFSYLLIFFSQYETTEKYIFGNGVFYKLATITFKSLFYQKLFLVITMFTSSVIILYYFSSTYDRSIILYFLILSCGINPIYQEYFDPLIIIMIFTFFKEKINFSQKRILFIFSYFLLFYLGTLNYYN